MQQVAARVNRWLSTLAEVTLKFGGLVMAVMLLLWLGLCAVRFVQCVTGCERDFEFSGGAFEVWIVAERLACTVELSLLPTCRCEGEAPAETRQEAQQPER